MKEDGIIVSPTKTSNDDTAPVVIPCVRLIGIIYRMTSLTTNLLGTPIETRYRYSRGFYEDGALPSP